MPSADVVLTGVFLVNAADAGAVARVHGQVSNTDRPVTSAVRVAGWYIPSGWSQPRRTP